MNESHDTRLPRIEMDARALGDLDRALSLEWLVTNGAGGYAMGSVPGATTRTYHAYLIAAPRVPQERVALVTQLEETVTLQDDRAIPLSVCEYASGEFSPQGFERLARFTLDGLIPTFIYHISPGLTLNKMLWMERGADITYVRYRLEATDGADTSAQTRLTVTPYCVNRDHHAAQHAATGERYDVQSLALLPGAPPNACEIRARPDALPCQITTEFAVFTPQDIWKMQIEHRVERERGLDSTEDVYIPGAFSFMLRPGAPVSLVITAGAELPAFSGVTPFGGARHERAVEESLERERNRQRRILNVAGNPSSEIGRRLTLASDQFIVGRRPAPVHAPGAIADPDVTVIAGYPWFTDWGRDTMISLPGLTLATRRFAEARGLLRGFIAFMSQGMIPNRFPDSADAPPEYNTVDATLWLFHALDRYLTATSDWTLLAELFPALDSAINWHVRGTRYGIQVDAGDGLLRAGAEGVQLTWMDAKVDDWVVTPRRGKPVEISALWYRAVTLMGEWARRLGRGSDDFDIYDALAAQTRANFARRFWYASGAYLYDVVDVDGQPGSQDWSLRPNQILALSVAPDLVSSDQGRLALNAVRRDLLTPLGLRTLAPDDPAFKGRFTGDRVARDGAYHQGTVWPWLLGAYADVRAHFFPEEDPRDIRAQLLAPIETHLRAAGLGTVSEVTWGASPFTPAGCPAQAWSVAEALRLATGQ